MKLLVVVPAFNEAPVIGHTIQGIKKAISRYPNSTLLVIDDGSQDATYHQATQAGALVIRHSINRGLGGAISTGFKFARRKHFTVMVTIDADGQHHPPDIHRLLRPIIQNQADVVIGSRNLKTTTSYPLDRKILNHLSNLFTFIIFGVYSTDSQSGLRAFGPRAITSINLKTQRMEVSSEIFSEIKRLNLRYQEVPIKVIYTSYSRAKGQSNLNSISIITKLILKLFR